MLSHVANGDQIDDAQALGGAVGGSGLTQGSQGRKSMRLRPPTIALLPQDREEAWTNLEDNVLLKGSVTLCPSTPGMQVSGPKLHLTDTRQTLGIQDTEMGPQSLLRRFFLGSPFPVDEEQRAHTAGAIWLEKPQVFLA